MKAKILTLASLILVGFLAAIYSIEGVDSSQQELNDIREITRLAEQIKYYDEVLTMSARMAAVQDSLHWIKRYYEHTRPLDDAINSAIALIPEITAPLEQVDDANQKLIAMEEASFEFSRKSQFEEAQSILFSKEYKQLKQRYKEGLDSALRVVATINQKNVSAVKSRVFWMELIILFSLLMIVVAAYYIYKIINHSLQSTSIILEALPFGVTLTDQSGVIRHINQAGLEMVQRSESEVVGQSYGLISLDREGAAERYHAAGTGGISETELLLKSGAQLPVLRSSQPITDISGKKLLLETFVDITERKRIEEALLIAKQRAEEASHSKSAFLATMSHEIRTPMNAIQGMTDLLLKNTELTAEQQEFAEIVQSSSEALLTLINDILDYSKVESNRMELEMIDFDLEHLVNDVVALLDLKAQLRAIKLIVDYAPECPQFVTSDPGRLRQILVNLMGNAIKFTQEGHVLLRVQHQQDFLHFSVEDTGIGITEEQQQNLFQVFSQADNSTTREYGGTGLGLAISKRLVNLFGGEIGVESSAGQGSTFFFTIPLQVAEKPRELPYAELGQVRILVVDDYEPNRTVFKRQLESFGMQVDTADDAISALALMRDKSRIGRPVDIVLSDQNMPKMDGLQFTRAIKQAHDISPAVVVVTSSGHRGNGDTFRKAGAAGYLVKPVSREMLFYFLTSVMGGINRPQAPFVTRHLLMEHFSPTGKLSTVQPQDQEFRGRVLVAEDTPANVVVIRTLLTKLGLEVEIANSGKEAVAQYESSHFDLIFMDLRMPEMDGLVASRIIRQQEQSGDRHTPIIALTADVVPKTREETAQAGMDGFVVKPFKRSDILGVLEKYLTKSAAAGAEVDTNIVEPSSLQQGHGPVDEAQLSMMRDNLGEDFDEFIEAYLLGTQESLDGLYQARESNDLETLQRNAHSIKSSSLNAGATHLSEMARELEFAVREQRLNQVLEQIGALQKEFDQVRKRLSMGV